MLSHGGNTSHPISSLLSTSWNLLLIRCHPTVPPGVCVFVCSSTQAPVCTHVFIGAHILESQKRTAPLTGGWVIAPQGLRLCIFNANPKEGTGFLVLDGQNVPLALETACPGMQAILSYPKGVMQIGVHPVGRHDPGSSSDKNLGICLLSRRPMITLSLITFPGQQPLPSRKTFPEPPVNG